LLRSELLAAVESVIDSQQFVLGSEVAALEREIADYSNTNFAIGCASGSDALLLALMALDLQPGDEVVTTPFSFFATGSAITRLGASPRFVDIDPQTYNIDPSQIEAAISKRTRAIMPVHLYGQCADMDAILTIAERHGLPVIEDAAQAIGAEDRGRRAGSMGRVGCFSFYPTKNLGGAGDGGMLVANDEALAERLRRLRVHGGATEYHHDEVGINSRLDAMQAAILRVKLRHLQQSNVARRRIAQGYRERLSDVSQIVLPAEDARGTHVYHQFTIRCPRRDAIRQALDREGIASAVFYPVPIHRQPAYALANRDVSLPASESAAASVLSLPIHPHVDERALDRICEVVRSHA